MEPIDAPGATTVTTLGEDRPSLGRVLDALGVDLAPTLPPETPGSTGLEGVAAPQLGRFRVVGELGRGGMGQVLEGRDPDIRRSVAIKVVFDQASSSQAQLARFVAEAQITGQLQHPNIVPVHEVGLSDEGLLYFVMKKVGGRTLRQVISDLARPDGGQQGDWTDGRLLHAFVQVCHAVAYAHDRGVLHRDLKPDNIMLGPYGEVLLMDWGVARLIGEAGEAVRRDAVERVATTQTLDGATIGTPGYMSPEQAEGRLDELDGRSDVWSLGAILWWLAKLFVMQGLNRLLVSIQHPNLHFPGDTINVATKAMLPPAHLICRLLAPHAKYTLGLHEAVVHHRRSVIHNSQREIFSPFPVTTSAQHAGLVLGRVGAEGNPSFPPFRFDAVRIGGHTRYAPLPGGLVPAHPHLRDGGARGPARGRPLHRALGRRDPPLAARVPVRRGPEPRVPGDGPDALHLHGHRLPHGRPPQLRPDPARGTPPALAGAAAERGAAREARPGRARVDRRPLPAHPLPRHVLRTLRGGAADGSTLRIQEPRRLPSSAALLRGHGPARRDVAHLDLPPVPRDRGECAVLSRLGRERVG